MKFFVKYILIINIEISFCKINYSSENIEFFVKDEHATNDFGYLVLRNELTKKYHPILADRCLKNDFSFICKKYKYDTFFYVVEECSMFNQDISSYYYYDYESTSYLFKNATISLKYLSFLCLKCWKNNCNFDFFFLLIKSKHKKFLTDIFLSDYKGRGLVVYFRQNSVNYILTDKLCNGDFFVNWNITAHKTNAATYSQYYKRIFVIYYGESLSKEKYVQCHFSSLSKKKIIFFLINFFLC